MITGKFINHHSASLHNKYVLYVTIKEKTVAPHVPCPSTRIRMKKEISRSFH